MFCLDIFEAQDDYKNDFGAVPLSSLVSAVA